MKYRPVFKASVIFSYKFERDDLVERVDSLLPCV